MNSVTFVEKDDYSNDFYQKYLPYYFRDFVIFKLLLLPFSKLAVKSSVQVKFMNIVSEFYTEHSKHLPRTKHITILFVISRKFQNMHFFLEIITSKLDGLTLLAY